MIGYLAAGFGIWSFVLLTGSGPLAATIVAVVIVGGFAFLVKGHEDRPLSTREVRKLHGRPALTKDEYLTRVVLAGYHLRHPPGKR